MDTDLLPIGQFARLCRLSVKQRVMEDFMAEHGLVANGPHHEIYLTSFDDPTPRTLLRQPVRSITARGSSSPGRR